MRQTEPYALIIGGADDGQHMAVLDALEAQGAPYVFLDHCANQDIAFDVTGDGRLRLWFDGEEMPRPSLVWTRIKINALVSVWTPETVDEHIRRSEWRGFMSAISAALNDVSIYTLSAVAECSSRIRQMQLAAKCGFVVPESQWFVGKAQAMRFADRHNRIVAKPIAVRNVPKLEGEIDSYRVLFTMGLEGAEVASIPSVEFEAAPALFQERLPRGVEHRVIAFRGRAFSYAIKGRIEDKFRPDERVLYGGECRGRKIYGAQYSLVETPPFVVEATSRFLAESGLQYGAFDLIEDDGRWSFIECNPEGQWYAASLFNMNEVAGHFAEVLAARLADAVGGGEKESSGRTMDTVR